MARDHVDTTANQPRAIGAARIDARLRGGATVLAGLRQQGSAKAMVPRTGGEALEGVFLNTAGGVTGGDRFDYAAAAEAGARLTLATQTAERAYRAQDGQIGEVRATLSAGPGARLAWLPQETILFDRSALRRRLEVDLAADARFLAVETLIFGRAESGERLTAVDFTDNWRIRREGRLIHAEATRLSGVGALTSPAALEGAGAAATVLLAAPEAEALLGDVRALLPPTAGASAFDDKLVVRMLAPSGFTLRRTLIPVITLLNGAPPPRVWMI